jgi:hypothetical protein
MHKESFIINRNTLLHVSTLLDHLQEELFCYRYTKVVLYSWVRMCCWLCAALSLEAWTLCGPGLHCRAGPDRREFTPPVHSAQSIAHSHSTIKCNLSVTITKSSPWRWSSRVETCRIVLRLMIKLSLCICWWLVFLIVKFLAYVLNGNLCLLNAVNITKVKLVTQLSWHRSSSSAISSCLSLVLYT